MPSSKPTDVRVFSEPGTSSLSRSIPKAKVLACLLSRAPARSDPRHWAPACENSENSRKSIELHHLDRVALEYVQVIYPPKRTFPVERLQVKRVDRPCRAAQLATTGANKAKRNERPRDGPQVRTLGSFNMIETE